MDSLRDVICQIVFENQPMTVRQIFYQLVSLGIIAKNETEYKSTVVRLLSDMRLAGTLPFGWIAVLSIIFGYLNHQTVHQMSVFWFGFFKVQLYI